MYSRRSPRNVKLQCRPIRSQHFIMNNLFLLINFIKFSFWLKWTFGTNCYIQLRVFEKKKHLLFFFSLCYTCNFYHVCHHILQLNFISLVFIEALLLFIYSKDTRYKVMWLPFITYHVTLTVGLCVCKTKGVYHTTTSQSATTATSASWMMPAKSRVRDV